MGETTRYPRQNRSPVRFYSIYNNSLFSEAKKRIYPFQYLATNSIAKQFAFKEFMRGVSNAFSKSNMNVSTCPLLSKILAQSFITVVNWVSQLCPFLNACCLSDRSLYSSRWAMIFEHTMCSSNLHYSRKPGENCTQVTCHSSWKGGRYLQETSPLGFHQCLLIATQDETNSVASSFRTLGWSSSGPKALEGFKPLRNLITLRNTP